MWRKEPLNLIMNWEVHSSICYTKNSIFKEGRKPEVKIFPWEEKHSVLELCASSVNSVFANLIKIPIPAVLFHIIIFNSCSVKILWREKKNPRNQPLRCHHTEKHSCSFFWLFPAIWAIKIININRWIYPWHRSTKIKHSEKAILNNIMT